MAFVSFLEPDSPTATSAASPPCQGPLSQLPPLGKGEPTGLAPIRPSTYSPAWEWGKGDAGCGNNPKISWPPSRGWGSAPQDCRCSAGSPSPWPPAWLLCEPPPAQKGLGCGVLHLSPFPSSTSRLGWGEKSRFREDSVGAHGGWGGGGGIGRAHV